jgi:hypothetical protein
MLISSLGVGDFLVRDIHLPRRVLAASSFPELLAKAFAALSPSPSGTARQSPGRQYRHVVQRAAQ